MQASSHICVYIITYMHLQCYIMWQSFSTYLKIPTHFVLHCDFSCIVWFWV